MGTKIQDYDLEPALRELTGDIRTARTHFKKDVTAVLKEAVAGQVDHEDRVADLESATALLDGALKSAEEKLALLQGLVGYASAGEEDDETFTYDPVTEDIIKHEVTNGGTLKFKIEYAYQNGAISQAVKTYVDGTDEVTVTTSFTYNQSGNVSAMSHRRTVTPIAQP